MTLGDFTNQAEAYGRARPHYPEALIDRLIEAAGAQPGDAVVDLGAGTGIFSGQLLARGLTVTAVEPNDAMRAHATTPPGRVRWMAGTFEETGLDGGSQAFAVASQSFHWADPPRALPEIRRILRGPGSLFVPFWNNRLNDESEVLAFTRETLERLVPELDSSGYRDRDWTAVLTATGDFVAGEPAVWEIRHQVRYSRERYLDLWRSHNRLAEIGGPERLQQVLAAIDGWFADRGVDEVEVPYNCRAFPVVSV